MPATAPTLDLVVTLDDGAIVRGASESDLPEMLAIEADRESDDDAVDLQLVAETPGGLDSMSVVENGGRVVSIATLLDETLTVGDTELPCGQIEMVATAREFEGRGYVRALMHRCHELSRARGQVVQVMIGIPNFYRQFGYAYSIRMHPWATVDPSTVKESSATTRVATSSDLTDCRNLQDAAQRAFDVAMPHSDDCWTWLVRHASSKQVLATSADGQATGLARVYDDGEGSVDVGEITGVDEATIDALLRHALELAGPDGTVRVNLRPTAPGLADRTHDVERTDWYYVRVPDPALLLTALAPTLVARAGAAGADVGELMLSFFRRHVRLAWSDGRLTVTAGGPIQAPVSAGGSGVPVDALGTLLFGDGADCLEERFPDASLGRQADLMRALFPAQRADLLTFYLPS